ncbi:hypothetical protein C8R45DRAFT_1184966 [Mycena sanguinolenta]|nr:hypothetical protein C8R45DRAFT_1184966 [Mycena sanguinolenta]
MLFNLAMCWVCPSTPRVFPLLFCIPIAPFSRPPADYVFQCHRFEIVQDFDFPPTRYIFLHLHHHPIRLGLRMYTLLLTCMCRDSFEEAWTWTYGRAFVAFFASGRDAVTENRAAVVRILKREKKRVGAEWLPEFVSEFPNLNMVFPYPKTALSMSNMTNALDTSTTSSALSSSSSPSDAHFSRTRAETRRKRHALMLALPTLLLPSSRTLVCYLPPPCLTRLRPDPVYDIKYQHLGYTQYHE